MAPRIAWRAKRYRPSPDRPSSFKRLAVSALIVVVLAVGVLRAALALVISRDPAPPPAPLAVADPVLSRLPLIEVPATQPGDTFIVYLTGDNGWQKADKGFARELAALGRPVVAVDSLRYFSHARGETETAADLSRLIAVYARAWGRPRFILAGYSFGAGAAVRLASRLDPPVRSRLAAVALVAPGRRAEIVLHDYSLFDLDSFGSPGLAAARRAIGPTPVICITARADHATPCASLSATTSRAVASSHTFKGHYAEVARLIAGPID